MIKIPTVNFNINQKSSEIDLALYLTNDFVPCNKIFPFWLFAQPFLKNILNLLESDYCWDVGADPEELTRLSISVKCPYLKEEISGIDYPFLLLVPVEERQQVLDIWLDTVQLYVPKNIFEQYQNVRMTQSTYSSIKSTILTFHEEIKYQGGVSFIEKLSYAYGLPGINHISLNFDPAL